MAKIEGTQSIPSEILNQYRSNITDATPDNIVRKRYPYRIPLKQDNGYKVTLAQRTQRNRWNAIQQKFANISPEVRQRWYAARPPWHSLLWYYNYFMMSGLTGNAVIGDKGGGVIKDINHYTFTLPAGTPANVTIPIDTCDPNKSVVFFFGAGYYGYEAGVAVAVYPYLVSLNSTQAIVKGSLYNNEEAGGGISLIEYI
jgi:hypothetical protein